jgi:porphobilinogen synthase
VTAGYPVRRLRRLRYHPTLRLMLQQVRLDARELVAPLFVHQGISDKQAIAAMPGQFQWPLEQVAQKACGLYEKGLRAVLLFGIPKAKDATGQQAWAEDGVVQQALGRIKRACPELLVIADTCLCEYTSHGHCGPAAQPAGGGFEIDNEAALAALARTAVSQARSGADVVAPSAMMDGQVQAIRRALDAAGMEKTPILSYAVKFASALYGPFRSAAESAPAFGDRRSYQMDPLSPAQALAEARSDVAEGADMIMVKPALPYLDVLAKVCSEVDVPVVAYTVSGEFAMVKFAAAAGAIDERQTVLELTAAVKRAGADLIVTYFAELLADWLKQ